MIYVLEGGENNGVERLKVGIYLHLILGSRNMSGCMDIGLATLQDIAPKYDQRGGSPWIS